MNDERKPRTHRATGPGISGPVGYLTVDQLQELTRAFEIWHDSAKSSFIRRVRGRYRLAFLFLRFTGARISEILRLDDMLDVDYGRSEIRIPAAGPGSRRILRTVPVPAQLISRLQDYVSEFPMMHGRVFVLDQGNFRREFYRRAEEASIPRPLSHPHILRHTRAVEMLAAGVPLTTVQDLLGHVLRSTTALYLQHSEVAARKILKEKGLL